jgi:DHA1 family inner membrane transport protein
MPFAAPTAILVFLWGVVSFALVPPLQVRVMTAAEAAPNLVSSVNIGAFNLGNAIGAAAGGGVIATGMGYPAVALAGTVAALIGLAGILLASRTRAPSEAQPVKPVP